MSEVQRYKDRCNDSGSVPDQTHIDDLEELEQLRQLCREQHLALMWWKDFINDESAPIGNELIRKAIEKYNSVVSK